MQRTSLNSGSRNCRETTLPASVDAFPGHIRSGCSHKAKGVELGPEPPPPPPQSSRSWGAAWGGMFYCRWSADCVESWRPAPCPWLAAAAGGRARVSARGAEPVFPMCSSRLRRGGRAGVAAGWAGARSPGAACRGRTAGSGLRAAGSGLRAGGAGRRAGGWVGAARGRCGRSAWGGGGAAREAGAWRGGGGRRAAAAGAPSARTAEHGGGGAAGSPRPCPLAPVRAREQQVKPARRQRAPFPPPDSSPASRRPPLPPSAPRGSGFPDAPAAFFCHCDVTKGRARVEPSPPP